jgi:hypothetical protein
MLISKILSPLLAVPVLLAQKPNVNGKRRTKQRPHLLMAAFSILLSKRKSIDKYPKGFSSTTMIILYQTGSVLQDSNTMFKMRPEHVI